MQVWGWEQWKNGLPEFFFNYLQNHGNIKVLLIVLHQFCVLKICLMFICQEVLWGGGCSSGGGGGASGRYADWTECHWLQVHLCSFTSFLWVAVTFSCAAAGQDVDHSLNERRSINTCWHKTHTLLYTHTHTHKYRCQEQPLDCFGGSSHPIILSHSSYLIKCICWLMLKFSFSIDSFCLKGEGLDESCPVVIDYTPYLKFTQT